MLLLNFSVFAMCMVPKRKLVFTVKQVRSVFTSRVTFFLIIIFNKTIKTTVNKAVYVSKEYSLDCLTQPKIKPKLSNHVNELYKDYNFKTQRDLLLTKYFYTLYLGYFRHSWLKQYIVHLLTVYNFLFLFCTLNIVN